MNFISFVLFLFTWNIETVIRSSSSWWKWWAEKERKLFTLCLFESSIETYAYTLTKKNTSKKNEKKFRASEYDDDDNDGGISLFVFAKNNNNNNTYRLNIWTRILFHIFKCEKQKQNDHNHHHLFYFTLEVLNFKMFIERTKN